MHPALQVHVLIRQSVFFLDETVSNIGGNLYIKAMKPYIAKCLKKCRGNVKNLTIMYYRMTQAGSIMIKKTAQNCIYNTKGISKCEGEEKSRNSREYLAYGVVSSESVVLFLFGSVRENTLTL
jgi:hypothetical protein